jgi:hypothetical protein
LYQLKITNFWHKYLTNIVIFTILFVLYLYFYVVKLHEYKNLL